MVKFLESAVEHTHRKKIKLGDLPNGPWLRLPAPNAGAPGLIPELEKAPGEGRGYPLQYSGLENYMDCIVHGVVKSWTRPSDFHFHFFPTLSQKPLTRSRQPLSKVCSVSRSPNVSKEARNVDFYVILLT